jgi:hypothetical protein
MDRKPVLVFGICDKLRQQVIKLRDFLKPTWTATEDSDSNSSTERAIEEYD